MNLDAKITTIMTDVVETVSPDQLILDIKHLYERPQFHSHIPVVQNEKLIGIVSIVNFMRAIQGASLADEEPVYQTTKVHQIMSLNPVTVAPESTIRDVVKILSRGEFHSVVIASNGKVEGITTSTDILRLILED